VSHVPLDDEEYNQLTPAEKALHLQGIEDRLRDFWPQGVTSHEEHLAHLHRTMTNILANPDMAPEVVAMAEAYLKAFPAR
jgi:hypothetical protein